jgi:hypothetical protein
MTRSQLAVKVDMAPDALTRMADNLMIYKYVVENVVRQRGITANFIPIVGSRGSGVGVYQSIWLGERAAHRRQRLCWLRRFDAPLHRRPCRARSGVAPDLLTEW